MPWINAGTLTLAPNAFSSVAIADVTAYRVGVEILGVSGYSPFGWGYLAVWGATPFPGSTAIAVGLGSFPLWTFAATFRPANDANFTLRRMGFKRTKSGSGSSQFRLWYLTP